MYKLKESWKNQIRSKGVELLDTANGTDTPFREWQCDRFDKQEFKKTYNN